ncbi:MAG: DHHW family protein [Evtepia sp.]
MKKIHILFVCGVMVILVAGLARTLLFPEEINTYENRYASQMPAFSAESYLDGSFQDGVDAALMDQLPLAETMKSRYNRVTAGFQKKTLDWAGSLAGISGDRYVEFNGLRLFGDDYVTYWPRSVGSVQAELDAKCQSLNETFARHPDLEFYVYYIEKDTDLDFETGEKTGLSQYLLEHLDLPQARMGVYAIDSFQDFSANFYKTDAHWNHQGSYRGYCQLAQLLGIREELLAPAGEAVKLSSTFSGKKASTVAGEGVLIEDFYGYPYAFPPMTVTINGAPAEDYGSQAAYLAGEAAEPVSYGGYYGGDNGETVFSTGTQGRGNLLVVGESFDNAVLKLLASHYDTLYSVDLRYYEHSMGVPFDFSAYVQEHQITRVLLMGNIDFYIQDIFDLEG